MDISSVNSDLIRGNVTTIILGCLKDEDKYGYEILKEIEDKSHSQYAIKQATLYNQLKRLEKQGLVSSYDGAPDDTGGGKRRYFALTPEGKNYLLKEKGEYEYARTILDKLVSDSEFDFTKDIPFDASELRPYSKRGEGEEKPKVVYKDKIVEVEKIIEVERPVEVEKVVEVEKIIEIEKPVEIEKIIEIEVETEKRIYIDRFGNPLTEEEYERATTQALLDDEKARKTEEDLKLAEEKYAELEKQLRELEEEHVSTEEQLHSSEIQRSAVEEELRRLHEEREAEEERRRIAQSKPSTTVDELFAKLDSQSEYQNSAYENPTQIYADIPDDGQSYFEHTETEQQPAHPQTTLQDLFRQIDEKTAQMEAERARKQEEEELRRQSEELFRRQEEFERQQELAADALAYEREFAQSEIDTFATTDSYGATSATVSQNENGFEYEKNHVNYRDFFTSINDSAEQEEYYEAKAQPQPQYVDGDIKTRLYSKGFKIRPYDKGNTSEYYTFNFIQSNRINRDTFLCVLALFIAEIAVMWLSLATRISYVYFLPIAVVGIALCLIPTVICFINPTRRTRANFNFKLSILNRSMLFIELTVVCILIGFFALGASVNDIDLILCSMVIPAIILLNLPISSVIYWLLYRTRKYHIA